MGYGLVSAHDAVLKALETICYSDLPFVHGVIDQNATWNTPLHATGTVTVSNGATLTIVDSVRFEPNVGIIVNPGGKLIIDGATLTAACSDGLWQGIVVLGNENDPQLPNLQGTVELRNGAVIEHAVCAVSAGPILHSIIGEDGGGIIQADSVIFRNNLQAIHYRSYEYQSAPGVIADNVGKFARCVFTVDASNRFAVNGQTFKNHVKLWEVRGITFEGSLFENNVYNPGMLSQEIFGIHTMDAGFKVINYCDPKPAGPYIDCACSSPINIPSAFQNLATGIQSDMTSYPRPVFIDQSQFQNLSTGVRMNAQTNYRLTRCDLHVDSHGLISSASSGYRIEENNFSSSTNNAVGIFMDNSGGAENRIYNNRFDNLNKGISVSGINSSVSNIAGLQFICNYFERNKYDIHILSRATVRLHQGRPDGADNTFIATNTSSIFSGGSQAITYYHSPNRNFIPYNPTSNITVVGTAPPNLCASTFCLPDDAKSSPKAELDSLEQYKMMQDQYDRLLAALDKNPELLSEILILSDAMREMSDHAINRILHNNILYLDALKSWFEIVRTPVANYSLAEVYASERKYEQADALLKAMPEMFQFGKVEMEEHDNYLKFFNLKKTITLKERNWSKLTDEEIKELENIAQATCGRSATMAQGVLCFFYDNCKEYEECNPKEIENPKIAEAEEETVLANERNELTIRPNPTTGELQIQGFKDSKIQKAVLYDLFRRQVFETTETTFNISHLPKGVYIIRVYLENEEVVTRKIVKQ